MPASTLTFVERPNLRALHFLSHMSYNKFKNVSAKRCKNEKDRFSCFNTMKRYVEHAIGAKGTIECNYAYSNTTPIELGGRLYAHHSIQQVACEIRGLLFKHTTDIDMVNCHCRLLLYLCTKNNISCEQLKHYVDNRDAILQSICESENMKRGEAKDLFISAMNDSKKNYKIKDSFFRNFDNEMKEIQTKIVAFPQYKAYRQSVPDEKHENETGCTMSRILCGFENEVLQCCIEMIQQATTYSICTLMYDGLMIEGNHYNNPSLLHDLQTHIEMRYPGLNMRFAYKPHDDSIIIPTDFNYEDLNQSSLTPCQEKMMQEQNHQTCANVIYELMDDIYVCVDKENDRWYKYNEQNALWETGPHITIRNCIYDVLVNIIETAIAYIQCKYNNAHKADSESSELKPLKKTLDNYMFFKRSVGSNNFQGGIYAIAKDKLFVSKFEDKINQKLYCLPIANNMVLNLKTNECVKREKTDYFSIECKVAYNPNDIIDGKEYFDSMFEDKDTQQCVLDILKSSLTGVPLRNIFIWIGKGRNGKSLLLGLLREMLGDFCSSVSKNVILQPTSKSNITCELEDLAKYRVAVLSELSDSDVLYDTRVKEFTGDGVVSFRGLWKKDQEIVVTCTVHAATNVMPVINCNDQAILTRIIPIPFKKQFEEDMSMKDKILSKANSIFSYIIVQGVLQKSFNINRLSNEIQNSRRVEIEDNNRLYTFIKNKLVASCVDMKYIDFYNEYAKYIREDMSNDTGIENNRTILKAIRNCEFEVAKKNNIQYILRCSFN